MKKLLLGCLCILSAVAINAQTEDKKWNIGLHGGATQYEGDWGNDFYKTNTGFFGFGGLSVSRYLGKHLDISFLATRGIVGSKHDSINFKNNLSTISLNLRFNILSPRHAVRPYLFVGGGALLFDKNININPNTVDYAVPSFGAGVNFRLSNSVMLNLQEMFMYTTGDDKDGKVGGGNDAYAFHSLGLTFNFGKKKDSDSDGVADHADKCPNTPKGVTVDMKGCPLDKDNDGTPDYLDACPDYAGPASLQGCPDKDSDGVADKNDRCPEIAGTAAFKGCPDTDGDGVPDIDDRCPTIAGSIELKGCPDKDNDGVADMDDKCPDTKPGVKVDANGCPMDNDKDGVMNEEDRCPDVAGPASLKGCPDTDGDGVPDIDDRCPAVKGTIANKGCPEMSKVDIRRITQIASKIFFQTNSDKLRVSSLVQLDALVDILKRYESANLVIKGYTDNVGDDDYNLKLSQKRTESVKKYLIQKGIAESRLTATGFGETNPIADNKTSLGRAKNRRVELETTY
ncbi:OmpA family protein [Ferruginibacter albus]|uniref:OmpA family protein n=1 Tax=Ferruginibacter albus TaxID=2875540 RepID=UPI0028F44E3C|nr:OmpA family protein [Ferruginibacter albus]UAY51222.1 OmpA family protein [Ferruginibacter albus]